VRVAVAIRRGEPDLLHQLLYERGLLGAVRDGAMDAERPRDDLAHPHLRVQRGVGILEDHLHVAPRSANFVGTLARQVLAAKQDLAAGRAMELQDGASGGRLPAAALSDQAERLAAKDIEGDAVHCLEVARGASDADPSANGEVELQLPHLEERSVGRRPRHWSK
jgi:hypothetical protein